MSGLPAWCMRKYGCKRNGQRSSVTGKPLLSNPEHILRVKGKNKWNKDSKYSNLMKTRNSVNLKRITPNYIIITFASKTKKHNTDRNVKGKSIKKFHLENWYSLSGTVQQKTVEVHVRDVGAKPAWNHRPGESSQKMKIHQDHFNTESSASSTLTCTSRRVMKFSSWRKSPDGNLDVVKK